MKPEDVPLSYRYSAQQTPYLDSLQSVKKMISNFLFLPIVRWGMYQPIYCVGGCNGLIGECI
jgi:hypothetical protein